MRHVVRPLPARVVRQECADQAVAPMLDAQLSSGTTSAGSGPREVDFSSYDEPAAGLYLYLLRRGDDEHVGVIADVSARAFVDGQVRGHEAVQPARVEALVTHFASASVRAEMVALLHQHGPAFVNAVTQTRQTEPVSRFTGPDGWEQTVWRIPEPESTGLADELSATTHYIADGHHRVAASLALWERAGRPDHSAFMCVIYPLDGLHLLAFHRRLTGPVDPDQLRALLKHEFTLRDLDDPAAASEDACFRLYTDGHWHEVTYAGERAPGAAGLDLAILDAHVLDPLLATLPDARLEITTALSPLAELVRATDEDKGALFALRPPPLTQLMEVADRGEVMPPKTTYFDPKPYAGVFLSGKP